MKNISKIVSALNLKPYSPEVMIDALKQFPKIERAYSMLNSRKRNYTLEKHTLMVCSMFEKYFNSVPFPEEFGINLFRMLLCLHDVGKPDSIISEEKILQSQYTEKMIEEIYEFLPINLSEYKILIALLSDDPLGLYIRGKLELENTQLKINCMAKKADIDMVEFMKLLLIYYQVDATAYTREGYIGNIPDFQEKTKLENHFKKNEYGDLVFSHAKRRLEFSSEIEEKISILFEGLV